MQPQQPQQPQHPQPQPQPQPKKAISPPTLLQQLQLAQQQQQQQRQHDRQQSSQLYSQAVSSAQHHFSSAAQPPPALLSSSPFAQQQHQYAPPFSAASASLFRHPPPPSPESAQPAQHQQQQQQYRSGSGNAAAALLSSAPTGSSSSFSASSASSGYPAPPFPSSMSALYTHFLSSPPASSSAGLPAEHHYQQQQQQQQHQMLPAFSSSSHPPTPHSALNPSSLQSLLFPQSSSSSSALPTLPSLSALNSLSLSNPAALNLLLSSAASSPASLQQQQQRSGHHRLSLSDSMTALQYLSSSSSSPFSSFPPTPTSATTATALASPLSAQSPRFIKAVALESDPFDALTAGLKGSTVVGRVKRACGNCKAAKTKCDSERPCRRCSRTGRSSSCNDSVHKKRGRKRNVSGGDGGEGGEDGDSGEEEDEDEAVAGGDEQQDDASNPSQSHRHVEKKARPSTGSQAEAEQLRVFLLDCAVSFDKHLQRWREQRRQQRQQPPSQPSPQSSHLSNALAWFELMSRTDSMRKLLWTGKDGVREDASSTDIDLLTDGDETEAALLAAQREIESGSDTPGYALPLYPVPYILSPATFLSRPKLQPSSHPPPPQAFFNPAFCQLLSSSSEQLGRLFSHLPSFLSHCSHSHLDQSIGALVDAVCSARPSATMQGQYRDRHGQTFDCIEVVSVHAVRGVPVALAISLHSIVAVGRDGGRLLEDAELARLADSEDEDDTTAAAATGAPAAAAPPPAIRTVSSDTLPDSPIVRGMGVVSLLSPGAGQETSGAGAGADAGSGC